MQVRCVEKEPTGRVPFENLLADMEKSIFCLVLPETGQSARLLSEVMMAGAQAFDLQPAQTKKQTAVPAKLGLFGLGATHVQLSRRQPVQTRQRLFGASTYYPTC